MIISHKHKFIFIKTEKTAGTSMEIALSGICGDEDIITPISPKDEAVRGNLGYKVAQHYPISFSKYTRLDWVRLLVRQERLGFYNHMSASDIQVYTAPSVWDSHFKFCFERNPWDKLISWYYWVGDEKTYPTIKDFILSGKAGEVRGFELYTKGGILAVDKVYQLENMDAALQDISQRLGLEQPLTLPNYKAKSGARKDKRHYHEILTSEEAELISTIFAREIRYFGYKY